MKINKNGNIFKLNYGIRCYIFNLLYFFKVLRYKRYSSTQEVENKLIEDRHYTSTNRWVPTKEIKNGYVVNSRHTTLVSDAAALDMIVFW